MARLKYLGLYALYTRQQFANTVPSTGYWGLMASPKGILKLQMVADNF